MRRRRVIGWTVVGLAAGLIIVAMVVASIGGLSKSTVIREQQITNTKKIDDTARILRLVRSCTTPGQPCYERGQRQTAAAVGDINQVVVLAASCADKPRQQSETEIQGCIIRRLARMPDQ